MKKNKEFILGVGIPFIVKMNKAFPILYYRTGGEQIRIFDDIEILPSEFAVTNTDTIKYDEIIAGAKGTVMGIDHLKNTVRVIISGNSGKITSSRIDVHSGWLLKLSKEE